MKFKYFDSKTLDTLRSELQKVINEYTNDTGLSIRVGNMKYSSDTIEIKLIGAIVSDGSNNKYAKEAADFRKYANLYGLNVNHLGQTFSDYTILGLVPSRRKYPILCEKNGGSILITLETYKNITK